MRLFNEWMSIRTSNESITQWTWLSDKNTIEETESFLRERGSELFRDFQMVEVAERDGQVMALVNGTPAVTMFELEEMKFFPAT